MENKINKHRNIVRNSIIVAAILVVIFSICLLVFYFLIDNKSDDNNMDNSNYQAGGIEDDANHIEEDKEKETDEKKQQQNDEGNKPENDKESKESKKNENTKEESKENESSNERSNEGKSESKPEEPKQSSGGNNDLLNIKLDNLSEWNKSCDPHLIIVNRDNEIPERYNSLSNNMQKEVVNQLEKMIDDAKKDKESVSLWVSSRFRDIALQTRLFKREVTKHNRNGYNLSDAEKIASFYVAKPRTSEHNMGMAVDFNGVLDSFYKTKEYKWLIDHGPEYGFILRYPKSKESVTGVSYEPWHFRYVGADNAIKISKSGKCLEEYISSLK